MASRVPTTARTVVVGNRSVNAAYRGLQRIMMGTGLAKQLSRKRYYEKPTKRRERLEYEKCYRLYNREMKKKIEFVMKQHDPLPPV